MTSPGNSSMGSAAASHPTRTAVDRALDVALTACPAGRIVWGVSALAAPRANTRVAGMSDVDAPATDYLIRVFGARAVVLGLGHNLTRASHRRLWRRLGLMVDVSDTAFGLGHVVRRDVPVRSALLLTTITGAYAAVGALDLLRGRRATRQPGEMGRDDAGS